MDDFNSKNKLLLNAIFRPITSAAGGTSVKNSEGTYKTISIRSCIYCHCLISPGNELRYCKAVRCSNCNKWACFHCLKPGSNPNQESSIPCFGTTCNFAGIQQYTSKTSYNLIPGPFKKYM